MIPEWVKYESDLAQLTEEELALVTEEEFEQLWDLGPPVTMKPEKRIRTVKEFQEVVNKYKNNPLKYFMSLASSLFDLVIHDVMGLKKYQKELSKYTENLEDDPLFHIKELATHICKILKIKTEYEETISSMAQKIVDKYKNG